MRKIFSKITAILLICLVAIVPIVGDIGIEKTEASWLGHNLNIKKIDAATGEKIEALFKISVVEKPEIEFAERFSSYTDNINIAMSPTINGSGEPVEGLEGYFFYNMGPSHTERYNEPLTIKVEEIEAPEGYEIKKDPYYIKLTKEGMLVQEDLRPQEIEGLKYIFNAFSDTRRNPTEYWVKNGETLYVTVHDYELTNRKKDTSSFSVTKNVIGDNYNFFQPFKFKIKLTDYPDDFELKRYEIYNPSNMNLSLPDKSIPEPKEDEYRINFVTENPNIYGKVKSVNVKCNEQYILPTPEQIFVIPGKTPNESYTKFDCWAAFKVENEGIKYTDTYMLYYRNTGDESKRIIPADKYAPGTVINLYPSFLCDNRYELSMENGEFEIELYAGQKAFFDGIPVGTKYEIYEETPEGWVIVDQKNTTGVIEADKESEVEFTNEDTRTATVDIQGTKTWDDVNNQDGKRPDSITVNLLADGVEVDEKEVSGDWTYSFDDLPKYKDGKEITYTITEDEVEGYTTTIDGYDITNTYTPETIKIEGSKTWDDANNQDGKRPENITINLLADGEKIDSKQVSGVWKWLFDNLAKYKNGKEINYTITEDKVDEYTPTIDGYNVTNKYTPKRTEINVTKTWDDADNQDGKRPSNVTVNLLADGEKIDSKTITEKDNWTCKFDNLPQYKEGKEISYTVTEEPVADYTSTVNGYNITNSYTPGKTQVDVAKVWDDANNQDGKRPEKVTVKLFADGQDTGKTLELSETNKWTGSFTNLDKMKAGEKITYTIDEADVAGYTKSIDGYTITNSYKPETVAVEGAKTWNDADNQDGKRPESITVNLLADGVEIDEKQVTDDKWTFEALPKYKDGKEIVYTITEDEVLGYTSTIDGYNITNSYTPEVISVEGIKTWDDADNKDGIRPKTITVNLLADGKQIDSVEAIDTYSFKDLPKYKDGKEIVYTITETPVDGYETTIDGYNITNRHTPVEEPVDESTELPTETSTETPTEEEPTENPTETIEQTEETTEQEHIEEQAKETIIEETESVDTGDFNPTIPLAIIGASALALMLTTIGIRRKYR